MKFITAENYKFTNKCLWAAFLVSFPWIPLAYAELIHPHYDITGLFIPVSVFISITFIIASIVKKERQVLFLFIDGLVLLAVFPLPIICVATH